MRKYFVAAAFLLCFVAVQAQANGRWRLYLYYSDSAFTQYVGDSYTNCSLQCVYNCSLTAAYRIVEQEDCVTGAITTWCQQWNGTSWVTIACP